MLFVCVSNAGKSSHGRRTRATSAPNIHIASAGTHAKTAVNTLSAQVLAEVGVDISGHQPTQLTDQMLDDADLVVIVGSQAHLDNHPAPAFNAGIPTTLPTRHRRHPAHANHPRRHQHRVQALADELSSQSS